jgi:hypothetical protein
MTAVHTPYIAELAAQLRIASITASTSAGSGHPPQECPPPTLWPCCSPGTCITTGPSQGPQRSPDLQADSDHGSVLDRLPEDASARHDFFSLIGRITSSAVRRNDLPTVAIDGLGKSRPGGAEAQPMQLRQQASGQRCPAGACPTRRADKNRSPGDADRRVIHISVDQPVTSALHEPHLPGFQRTARSPA